MNQARALNNKKIYDKSVSIFYAKYWSNNNLKKYKATNLILFYSYSLNVLMKHIKIYNIATLQRKRIS